MGEYLSKFFDTTDFPARWHCGNWSEFLGWLHIASDLATFGAYFAIPMVLIYFARRRKDFPFTRLFWLFACFILACGLGHLIEAIIFWFPIYRVAGLMKLITATVSCATVVALIRVIPNVLHFPSLAANNERLERETQQLLRTEAELRAAHARHEALLSGTRSIVWTTDPEGRFARPQISWERYTGQNWSAHRDFGWLDAVHPDDRDPLLVVWQQACEERIKYQFSGRIWHQASSTFRAFAAEAVPVFDAEQNVIEWVGTNSDIEDQQQAELALRIAQSDLARQKRELELIYESAPVGMSLIDRDMTFLRVNKHLADLSGIPREAHIGRPLKEVLSELESQLEPIYRHIFATGQPALDIEVVGKRLDSPQQRTWLASYFPLLQDDLVDVEDAVNGCSHGRPVVAVSSIVQDITDRKLQEERLRRSEQEALAANQSKSEFLANMSHEIRTPMAAILGYADVLLGHLKDPDNRDCVLIVKKNGQYLLELINDILDLSRIEADKLEVLVEPTNLVGLVADIVSLMHVRASEKQLCLKARFDSHVPETISTDAKRLRQVLINLVGNAIKFTKQGDVTIAVRFVELPQPSVEFCVVDTGIGISKEQQSRLYKPFSQGDASVTREYGGSGLGLAISQRLVSMLGGELSADSVLGEGSTFRLRLPIVVDENVPMVQPVLDAPPAEDVAITGTPRRLKCRVLVVDDRREVRHISQHFLEKAGATVEVAEDGQEGFDIAIAARDSGNPYDLIVMDIQMPNVDGLQATAELRSAGIQWPIIALTADAMRGDRERCIRGGCDDYLSKPIDRAALIEMVWRYTEEISIDELRMQRLEHAAATKASLGGIE